MHRTYCKNLNFDSSFVTISDKEEVHHIKNVLKIRIDERISIFNGYYEEALCTINSISSKEISATINEKEIHSPNIPEIILACAIPKKGKFETIIEKATELGVDKIIPLQTKRTEVIITHDKSKKKLERFQTIAINASKQSKRISIPIIESPLLFKEVLEKMAAETLKIIPSLQEERKPILKVLQNKSSVQSIAFFIGPEGDFTDKEYTLAKEKGCIPVSLGKTTLKVETAALCALSCANVLFRN